MKFLLAEYGQRLLLSVFLVLFGAYLLVATITYTPFDPGWTHLSSDTQTVTNASGVAGAWIADLLYGFLGRAAFLLPLMVLIEAVQLWWPHSFVTRPFRLAAYGFLVVSVAALCSLHVYEPADTMSNAAGGIVGYELARHLLALLHLYAVTAFLLVMVLSMLTIAFGIRWSKTLETVGQLPFLLKELFYRNQPEPVPVSVAPPAIVVDTPAPAVDDVIAPEVSAAASEPEPLQKNAPVPADPPVKSTTAGLDAVSVTAPVVVATSVQPSTQRIPPAFAWDDQDVFNELLDAVPTPSAPSKSATPDEFDDVLSMFDTAINSPPAPVVTAPVLAPAAEIVEVQPVPVIQPEDQLAPVAVQQIVNHAAVAAAVEDPTDVDTVGTEPSPSHLKIAIVAPEPVLLTADVSDDDIDLEDDVPDRAVEPAEDWSAPLTDSHGRVMSRALAVAEKRAGLSPLPSMDLLDLPDPNRKPSYTEEELERLSELLEIKLQEFNIKAKVVEAQPGPVVTRFELELAPGVKASKVTNISRDLARSMSMASVRVVEVIPGKPYIGIEVPNKTREMVRLIELLQTPTYRDPAALISMAMGKDIAGRPVLADLAKAPHMLVAGTTGSGKSVAVNAMLLSMLLKYTPQQLRLILIDPKQLELANYGDIPHLLTPVVTDMKDAVSALNWSVGEMERRYKLMTLFKVRKIDEFNRKIMEANERGEDLIDPLWKPEDSATQDRAPRLKPLPLIVIVADEFADMIMQVGKKAEELITRLAQKSRAAGIHLMLATQRPSVDVITGLIKANIPTRVALRVNSKIDSRTILDAGGAEDMLGHGDMLFLGPGKIEPERVHGAFISDDEVNRICDAWRERGSPDYVDDILSGFDDEGSGGGGKAGFESDGNSDPERDPMYDQVVAFVLETRKVSASSIQRKFSLGYNRAARLVDAMEAAGIVSPMSASGKRDILV